MAGCDFRQILPVVKNGTKFNIFNETIKFSNIWQQILYYELEKNMRARDQRFCEFLLKIGSGIIKSLKIPDNWKTNDICTTIYGSVINENDDLSNRAILSCHNQDVYNIKYTINKKYITVLIMRNIKELIRLILMLI